MQDASTTSSVPHYDVSFCLHGSVPITRQLLDVDGVPIFFEGRPFKQINKSSKRAFDCKDIRCIYVPNPGYRYFITSNSQFTRFCNHRRFGTQDIRMVYHVYEDEDSTIKNSFKFKKSRINLRVES